MRRPDQLAHVHLTNCLVPELFVMQQSIWFFKTIFELKWMLKKKFHPNYLR